MGTDSQIFRGDRRSHGVVFSHSDYMEIVSTIQQRNQHALLHSPSSCKNPWQCEGKAVILNLLYRYGIFDWAMLRSFDLDSLGSTPISQVVERLAPLRHGFDPELFPDLFNLDDREAVVGRGLIASVASYLALLHADNEFTDWLNAANEIISSLYS